MINKEKYYSLIQKENITEEEKKALLSFEDYIKRAKKYQPFLNDSANENIERFDNFYQETMNFPNLPNTLQEGIKRYQENVEIKNIMDIKKEQEREQEKQLILERTLKEKRAGYANGAVLLFIVLNLGMFLACLLLLTK